MRDRVFLWMHTPLKVLMGVKFWLNFWFSRFLLPQDKQLFHFQLYKKLNLDYSKYCSLQWYLYFQRNESIQLYYNLFENMIGTGILFLYPLPKLTKNISEWVSGFFYGWGSWCGIGMWRHFYWLVGLTLIYRLKG